MTKESAAPKIGSGACIRCAMEGSHSQRVRFGEWYGVVDRLGRSLSHLVDFLSEIHAKKVDLFIHQQGADTTTPAGKALFGMMGVFAEFERSMIQERVRSGIKRVRAAGQRWGRRKLEETDPAIERTWLRKRDDGWWLILPPARSRLKQTPRTVGSRLVFIHWHDSRPDAPWLYDQQGNYRGKLSANPYDPNSTSNPYGRYGSPFSPDSIKNPYGTGNPYSPSSPTNPYGRGLRIEGR